MQQKLSKAQWINYLAVDYLEGLGIIPSQEQIDFMESLLLQTSKNAFPLLAHNTNEPSDHNGVMLKH